MGIFWIIALVLTSAYSFIRYYLKTAVWCRSQKCLIGKTTVVTGANTGIGYETAIDFAKRGARVILACRDKERAVTARDKIIEETGNNEVIVKILDLGSFTSVRAFAKDINETENRLDILVNNAGVVATGEGKSEDGLLWIMQVNYFSNFLLTNLLIGLLKKSAPSRVVNVSSQGAMIANLDIDNLNESTGHLNNYCCSKLCNILFTVELGEKLMETNVTTFSVHPGSVNTEIVRHITGGLQKLGVEFMKMNFMKTSEEGAQTTIYTAVARNIEHYNGEHFDNCKRVEPYKTVKVPGLAKKLWEKSQEIVELKPEELQF